MAFRLGDRTRDTVWGLLDQGTGLVSSVLSFLLLGRTLGAAGYGAFVGLYSLIGPFSAFGQSGGFLTPMEHIAREHEDPVAVTRSCLSTAMLNALLWAPLVSTVGLRWIGGLPTLAVVLLVGTEFFLNGVLATCLGIVQAVAGFPAAARIRIAAALLRIGLLAALAAAGLLTLTSLAIGQAITVGTIVAFALTRVSAGIGAPARPGRIRGRHIRSVLLYGLQLAAGNVQGEGDKFVLNAAQHQADAGRYGAASRLMQIALLPITALAQATHLSFLRAAHSGTSQRRLALRMSLIAMAYAAAAVLCVFLVAPLIPRILTKDFGETTLIVQLLAPIVILRGVWTFPMNGLLGLGRNKLRTLILVGNALFSLVLYVVLIPRYSWRGALIATLLAELSLCVVFWVALLLCERGQAGPPPAQRPADPTESQGGAVPRVGLVNDRPMAPPSAERLHLTPMEAILPSLAFSPTATLSDDDVVLRRMHFVRKGEALYFLISRRPYLSLTLADAALWDALEGGPSVAALRAQFGAAMEVGLGRLLAAATCDLASRHPEGRRRVAVIEPHIDDAALSVGGTIWQLRDECEFTIITLASRSNFTSYHYLDRSYFEVERISALRKAEAELFARLTGGQHVALGQDEATLRYRDGDWTLEWFRRHRHSVSAFIGHRSGDAELRRWTDTVRAALRDIHAEELWIPLGVGAHTDHELARNACLGALLEEPTFAAGRELRLYQEVPYAAHDPGCTPRLIRALEMAGARLVPAPSSINESFDAKLRLLTVFGSQFKLKALRPDIEASARLASGGVGRSELLWRLETLPRTLEPLSLYVDAPLIEATSPLSRWRLRHRHAPRLRLLLLVPPGRWTEDLEFLLEAFPDATFDVYATAASEAEVTAHPSPRVKLRPVASGRAAWAMLSLLLAVSPPVPTAFLAGPRRLALAYRLSRLWPLSDTVVLPSLGHLVTSLRRAMANAEVP